MAPSSGRGTSIGQEERPECPHCHKRHYGIYRKITGGGGGGVCFRCGSIDHLIVNCSQGSGSYRNPQGSSR